jgi:chromosome segregation ATPase
VKRSSILSFGLVAMCLWPARAHAQGVASPGAGTLDSVAKEIRLLRQTLERQSSTAARVQLLIGRLSLQDQRTARAQQTVDRLQGEVASAERERDELQNHARAIAQRLEQAGTDERQALELESRSLRARLSSHQEHMSLVEARLSQARQALDAEAGRYDELDGWLRDLDKRLQGSE